MRDNPDILKTILQKLEKAGTWSRENYQDSAKLLSKLYKIALKTMETVEERGGQKQRVGIARALAGEPKKELDNYAIVRALDDLDLAVTSASFLVQVKVSLNPIVLDEIAIANKNYAVGLATVQSKANDPNIQKLNQLVVDPKLKDYINNYLKGTIAPVF
ncbi:MetQ/NlpA family ABC transporter substrate-binding protein [Nostoc sp. LPT]|uniref:MetQ/NlpA family ABC transporter substrate-binding protein n=1 Tax=Nostoc sp. LPT TaxID=2815387 RepID=UPI001DDC5297|nr:MetQ/NlpA family ABC transporter substrate-binding protein [Nostoc sp. LPT]MBN4000623.1 hypothetical protein [Nostoc sp. LPT]